MLKAYLLWRGLPLSGELEDADGPAAFRELVGAWIDQGDPADRRAIVRDWERVSELTDELGHGAIMRALGDQRDEIICEFKGLTSSHDRALWLFINRADDFERAEQISFARYYTGNKRYWSGFVLPRCLMISEEPIRLEHFKKVVGAHYASLDGSGEHVEVKIYEHAGANTIQVTMYIADLVDVALEFDGAVLTSRERQLARQAAALYSPETGALDIIAPGGGAIRDAVAALVTQHLLASDQPVERITLRQYRLDSLRRPRPFAVDPADRIFAVEVRRLRLEPRDGRGGQVELRNTPGQKLSIYERVRAWLHDSHEVPAHFDVVGARIAVIFMAKRGNGPGRTLSFDIAEPNVCTLKDHTGRQRLIAEKYLELWQLVAGGRPSGDEAPLNLAS